MSILVDKFPTKIRIKERIYDINADFRNCLKIVTAFEDDDLSTQDKYEIMIRRLYRSYETIPPEDMVLAVERGVRFLDCGEESSDKIAPKRVYSFEKDGKYIYSAIKQTHQVDLEQVGFLHWWKFVFLFSDINSDCALANIIRLRDKRNRGKLTKEERAIYNRSRDILDLEYDNRPTEDERDFMRRLKGVKK